MKHRDFKYDVKIKDMYVDRLNNVQAYHLANNWLYDRGYRGNRYPKPPTLDPFNYVFVYHEYNRGENMFDTYVSFHFHNEEIAVEFSIMFAEYLYYGS